MRTTFFKHALVSATASVTVLLLAGGVVSAHIDPDPIAMQVGTTGTVAFTVEHGCDGSPVNSVKIQIPAGVTGVAPVDKDGWTATVTGDTVEFKGGPLDAATEDHFDITLTAPAEAGSISFPAIETCDVGEIAWIEIPVEGQEEPEFVAPTLNITQNAPTAEELAPEEEAPEEEATTETLVTTSVTVAPADDSSNTGTIVIVIVIVAAALVGGGVLMTRRKNAAPKA
jgi:periplasmic copper chaperone A